MEKLRIGQMAHLNGVTEQTLRHYDRIGILKPYYVDKTNGYRYYDPKQSVELDLIHYMKTMGMSLLEIKKHIDHEDINYMKDILTKQLKDVEINLAKLQERQSKICHVLDSYYNYENLPPAGTMVYEHIPRRYFYTMEVEENIYDKGEDYYAYCIRKLGRLLSGNGIPYVEFCNVGTIVSQENFIKKSITSHKVFAFVDPSYAKCDGVRELKSNTYLSIYCDNFDAEITYIEGLLDELEQKNLTISGNYLCEDMVNLPFIHDNRRTMFYRIQIPIKFPQVSS